MEKLYCLNYEDERLVFTNLNNCMKQFTRLCKNITADNKTPTYEIIENEDEMIINVREA